MEETRKRKRQFCGHCNDVISHTLFYLHKKAYFRNGVWMKDTADAPQFPASVFCTQPVDEEHEQQHPENDEDDTLQDNIGDDEEDVKPPVSVFSNEERSKEATPLRREYPVSPRPSPNENEPLMSILNSLFKRMSEPQETFMDSVIRRLDRMESNIRELKEVQEESVPKKIKRAGNNSVAEAVRRKHNAESNMHRYDPQTSVSSPHNQEVTTHLLNHVSMAFPDVEPEVVKASCKTYYETIRKRYRMNQEKNLEKKEEGRITARMRQRKRRLHKARSSVLQTEEEAAIWKTATADMMSEEEDAILDGKPVWIVWPPARSPELSALCGVLQSRLEADQKYVVNHHARVGADRLTMGTTEAGSFLGMLNN